jgi:CBS domain-containing protein
MTTITETELRTGTVAEAMTPGVLACLPVTPLRDVARQMARHRVHAIVVFGSEDALHPCGVVSDLDLVAAIGTHANAGAVAASPVVTVTPDVSLEHAATLMREHATSHLLVVSDRGFPVGVISSLDVARALATEGDPGES